MKSALASSAASPDRLAQHGPKPPIVFVVPPFRSVLRPALGPSVLQANLRDAGIASEILYLNLRFSDRIGTRLYDALASQTLAATGDFIFSCVRYGKGFTEIEHYVDEVLRGSARDGALLRAFPSRSLASSLARLVEEAASLVDSAVEDLLERSPLLVGFSSSFQETLASLAIAHRLKQAEPAIKTVLGGANALAEMGQELFVRCEELDFVGQGECDRTLIELVKEHVAQSTPTPIAGFLRRDTDGAEPPQPATAAELERSPMPDFGDYFEQWSRLRHRGELSPGLIMETSRGCWWGAKRPCVFCGLNGDQWAFRSKSDARVLAEVEHLVERHGVRDIEVVDLILDNRRFRSLLPSLGDRPLASMFWETGGALSRKQVDLLARAGVRRIQPGFESLSDAALRLMGKPTTRLRNIQTLKWCTEAGIRAFWNYLCGLPGEDEHDLDEIESLVPLLHHLTPPTGAHLVRVQRFSRYCNSPAQYSLGELRPAAAYRHLYPFAAEALANLAYHFEADALRSRGETPAFGRLQHLTTEWRRRYRSSRLEIVEGRRGSWIFDSRRCARRRLRKLTAIETALLAACDAAAPRSDVLAAFPSASAAAADAALDRLLQDGLVLCVDGQVLSLPLRSRPSSGQVWKPAGQFRRWTAAQALRTGVVLRLSPIALARAGLTVSPRVVPALARRFASRASSWLLRSLRLVL